ncbi:atherin-like [Panicum virgatum]|uniref:atherin-like n=1 Tax=Panicum virgatum TaxID=38727 RepID=UPI0019D50302|nr:atherin-like [Panicum virgatum]
MEKLGEARDVPGAAGQSRQHQRTTRPRRPPLAGATPNRRRRSLRHAGGRDVPAVPASHRRAAAIRPIRSRHHHRPAPASIPNQTKSPLRAGPRSGHGPAGSGGCTSRRRGGQPAPASHTAGLERPCPPQPTSEERRKATPPPSPRAGRVAGDPLRQRHGVGERACGGGDVG